MHDRANDDGADLSLSAAAMRQLADAATDSLLARLQGLRDDVPWRGASRTELERLLREPAPETGQDPVKVLERAVSDVLPVAGRVDHPRFFAFVPSAPTWPGVVADYLAAGFNTFQGTWLGAGAPSQLELVVIDWIREWIGYPASAGGLFTSGGSAAILDALVAAREKAGAPDRPAIFLSDQTHSAVERAARIIGVRREGIVVVPSDPEFRLPLPALAEAVREARAAGFTPIAICANAGTTNTGAIDPLPAIADFCTAEDALAACRRGLWRLCRALRKRQGAARGHRTGRLDQPRCPQVAVPAIRSRLRHGQGRCRPGACVQRESRLPAGHEARARTRQLCGPRLPAHALASAR